MTFWTRYREALRATLEDLRYDSPVILAGATIIVPIALGFMAFGYALARVWR